MEPIGGGTTHDAEQQDWQVLAQQRHGDEEWIPRLRGDEQRARRQDDSIAGVVEDR